MATWVVGLYDVHVFTRSIGHNNPSSSGPTNTRLLVDVCFLLLLSAGVFLAQAWMQPGLSWLVCLLSSLVLAFYALVKLMFFSKRGPLGLDADRTFLAVALAGYAMLLPLGFGSVLVKIPAQTCAMVATIIVYRSLRRIARLTGHRRLAAQATSLIRVTIACFVYGVAAQWFQHLPYSRSATLINIAIPGLGDMYSLLRVLGAMAHQSRWEDLAWNLVWALPSIWGLALLASFLVSLLASRWTIPPLDWSHWPQGVGRAPGVLDDFWREGTTVVAAAAGLALVGWIMLAARFWLGYLMATAFHRSSGDPEPWSVAVALAAPAAFALVLIVSCMRIIRGNALASVLVLALLLGVASIWIFLQQGQRPGILASALVATLLMGRVIGLLRALLSLR